MYRVPQTPTINQPSRNFAFSEFRRPPQQQLPQNQNVKHYNHPPSYASSVNHPLRSQNIERPPQRKLPPVVRFSFIKNPPLNQQQGRNSGNRNSFELGEEICQLCEEPHQRRQMDSTGRCQHLFCLECLRKYCSYKVRVMEAIVCPNEACYQELDLRGTAFRNMSLDDRERYQQFILWRQTVQNPNLRLCPGAHCKGIIDTSRGEFRCPECRVRFCKECLLPQHLGSCDANFEQTFSDFKRCPRCRIFIEKIDGCNHMTCRCGHQFCYVCLFNWERSHYVCPPEVRRVQYGEAELYRPVAAARMRPAEDNYQLFQRLTCQSCLGPHLYLLFFAPFALLNIYFVLSTPSSSVCMGMLVFNGNTTLRLMMLIFGCLQAFVAIFGTLALWRYLTHQRLGCFLDSFVFIMGGVSVLILLLQIFHSFLLFEYTDKLVHACTGPLLAYLTIRFVIHVIIVMIVICLSILVGGNRN